MGLVMAPLLPPARLLGAPGAGGPVRHSGQRGQRGKCRRALWRAAAGGTRLCRGGGSCAGRAASGEGKAPSFAASSSADPPAKSSTAAFIPAGSCR
mmetsp:Transcript_34435/g.93301  ORF Transcript_34435/g.93301 Transcript_34435/m.93301 type:complete len:96 (-) Transcript_34435:146-433(-)